MSFLLVMRRTSARARHEPVTGCSTGSSMSTTSRSLPHHRTPAANDPYLDAAGHLWLLLLSNLLMAVRFRRSFRLIVAICNVVVRVLRPAARLRTMGQQTGRRHRSAAQPRILTESTVSTRFAVLNLLSSLSRVVRDWPGRGPRLSEAPQLG
jgi:hypothetical protein